ncbi:uncharacterized protein [Littorina saxatilis]|uniref:Uncharacterized protein n=1 Tax=Littorina saxatilis TaxID=31220 RepID=A0AAN9AZH3_9CAEN
MAEPPEQMQEPTGPMAASAVPIEVCENRTEEAAEQDLASAEKMNDSAEKKDKNVEQMSASAENKEEPVEKEETTAEEMSASAETMDESADQTKESAEQKAESEEHPGIAQCKERIEQWYPNLSTETHFVPAVYMNRTLHKPEKFVGRDVYVLQPLPQESDARDDAANNKVLRCIRQSSRGEVMFVISQLQFRNYLNKLTHPSGTPVPEPAKAADLKKQNVGDFDALIIHRHYGVLACEIKAVGDNFAALNMPPEAQAKTLERKLQLAVKQLGKSHDMLKHLVPRGKDQPRVKTTLMVPNISRDQLRTALDTKGLRKQKEKLCACLGIDNKVDPIPKCLTSDDVENPATWWQQCMELDGPDSAMTLDVYLDLVARFGGPATTVTVPCSSVPRLADPASSDLRTPGEGVMETANRFAPADIVLHPTQLDVLHNVASEPLVYLCGPPGTGKTLILILRALDWILNKGKPVHVVITRDGNMAASHMVAHQLKQMIGEIDNEQQKNGTEQADGGQQKNGTVTDNEQQKNGTVTDNEQQKKVTEPVHGEQQKKVTKQIGINRRVVVEKAIGKQRGQMVQLHVIDLPGDMRYGVKQLAETAPDGELFVLLDESCDVYENNSKNLFHQFITKLRGFAGKGLHIWAAGMYHEYLPDDFKEVPMDISLRTPPSITRHVMKHRAIGGKKNVRGYQQSAIPLPSDGPEPMEVNHEGPRHHEKEPYDCEECGRLVAAKLKSLGVGTTTARDPTSGPQPPRYRDVLILTWDSFFREANKATRFRPARTASGLIVGLREAGFPVTVLETGDDVAVGPVATMTGPDHVIAAGSRFVQGLERKIVVYVETDKPVYFDLDWGRLCAMSRCTSQLIHVKPPPLPPTRYQY